MCMPVAASRLHTQQPLYTPYPMTEVSLLTADCMSVPLISALRVEWTHVVLTTSEWHTLCAGRELGCSSSAGP